MFAYYYYILLDAMEIYNKKDLKYNNIFTNLLHS